MASSYGSSLLLSLGSQSTFNHWIGSGFWNYRSALDQCKRRLRAEWGLDLRQDGIRNSIIDGEMISRLGQASAGYGMVRARRGGSVSKTLFEREKTRCRRLTRPSLSSVLLFSRPSFTDPLLMVVASPRPPRKSTLSLREFSHLVSESLDVSHSANMSLLAHNTLFSEPEKDSPTGKGRSSPFQRIFARPSPGSSTPSPAEGYTEDTPSTPRKIAFTWPFIRPSPNKQRSTRDDPNGLVRPLHLAVCNSHISPRICLMHMPKNHPTL